MKPTRILILAAAALALAGCNADERGKKVSLGKGSYTGAPDTELSDATRAALTKRVAQQRFEGGLGQALRPALPPEAGNGVTIEGRVSGQRF